MTNLYSRAGKVIFPVMAFLLLLVEGVSYMPILQGTGKLYAIAQLQALSYHGSTRTTSLLSSQPPSDLSLIAPDLEFKIMEKCPHCLQKIDFWQLARVGRKSFYECPHCNQKASIEKWQWYLASLFAISFIGLTWRILHVDAWPELLRIFYVLFGVVFLTALGLLRFGTLTPQYDQSAD